MRNQRSLVRKGRALMLVSALGLCGFGLVMVYSASSVKDYQVLGNSAYHLVKQAQWLAAGLVAMALASRLDLRLSSRRLPLHRDALALGLVAWCASVAGLVLVFAVGVERYGAKRWLDFGPIGLQPSEFAKLSVVLLVAALLAKWRRGEMAADRAFWGIAGASLSVFALVILQPDMGTAVSIAVGVFVLLVLSGVNGRVLLGLLGAGAGAGIALIAVESYRMDRVLAFLDPWSDPGDKGYQIVQSLLAFGSGGLGGVGLGLSRQKFSYLPMAHTDFIFAIIGEELGLIGSLAVVAAFAAFVYGGFLVAMGSASEYDKLLAGGLTGLIGTQAVINMCAATGLMPVTGIPLPFVSYGGSSLMLTLVCVGLVLGAARRAERSPAAVPSRASAKRSSAAAVGGPSSTRKGRVREIPVERRRDSGAHLPRADRRTHPRTGRA
ncbi:putative lipid II flippase FtsW [Coriobacteriia bacterium Es71-Z0120]|uniref:putative lipid II flippase FtsW n=1 Tax=Parvivirga hydrogeniphila TaxID=2939460 RepID=UPI0022610285|nr:putative lipid II flippase FtsW [Parvivirga hydrogeniphila]MCL4079106.1 putative lipid II flippase FtsW [Parvivirga hydrogeniphila]